MSGAQTVHAAMSDARIAQAEERAKAILAEMAHTRTRCDDCGVVSPRLDDRGLHDGCAAGDWPRPPMRDWTKLEGIEGLREIANMMIDLVGDVRRSRELAASYDMDHALRDAAEQAELLQHGAERARDEARAEAHRLRARVTDLEATIAGRTTPPTDADLAAHERSTGLWRVRWAYLRGGWDHVETNDARRLRDANNGKLRWWPLDADGWPCAWPTAAEGAR